MTQHHPPTPPAIPNDAVLTGGTFELYPTIPTQEDIDREQELRQKMRKLQLEAPVPDQGEMLDRLLHSALGHAA